MIPRTLFSSDHETFRDTVRKFLENEAVPHHEEWEQTGQVPKALWRKAGEQGFLWIGSAAWRDYCCNNVMKNLRRAGRDFTASNPDVFFKP